MTFHDPPLADEEADGLGVDDDSPWGTTSSRTLEWLKAKMPEAVTDGNFSRLSVN